MEKKSTMAALMGVVATFVPATAWAGPKEGPDKYAEMAVEFWEKAKPWLIPDIEKWYFSVPLTLLAMAFLVGGVQENARSKIGKIATMIITVVVVAGLLIGALYAIPGFVGGLVRGFVRVPLLSGFLGWCAEWGLRIGFVFAIFVAIIKGPAALVGQVASQAKEGGGLLAKMAGGIWEGGLGAVLPGAYFMSAVINAGFWRELFGLPIPGLIFGALGLWSLTHDYQKGQNWWMKVRHGKDLEGKWECFRMTPHRDGRGHIVKVGEDIRYTPCKHWNAADQTVCEKCHSQKTWECVVDTCETVGAVISHEHRKCPTCQTMRPPLRPGAPPNSTTPSRPLLDVPVTTAEVVEVYDSSGRKLTTVGTSTKIVPFGGESREGRKANARRAIKARLN